MINILDSEDLIESIRSMKARFAILAENVIDLEDMYSVLREVETWRFSTGPLFDEPPFSSEMAGYDGGRILKKSYVDIYGARLKGAYSSGFIDERHVVTVFPSKPVSSPLIVKFFKLVDGGTEIYAINYYNNESFQSTKKPALVGMGRIFNVGEAIKACVVVGAGPAYSVTVYYCDSEKRIIAASMVAAPIEFQYDYEMCHNNDGQLEPINSGGVIWQGKPKAR